MMQLRRSNGRRDSTTARSYGLMLLELVRLKSRTLRQDLKSVRREPEKCEKGAGGKQGSDKGVTDE